MLPRLSIAQKGIIAVLILVVAEVSFVAILSFELNTLRNRLEKERQARVIVEHINRISTATERAAAEALKAMALPGDRRDGLGFVTYKPFLVTIRQEIRILRNQLQYDPGRIKTVLLMEALTDQMEESINYLFTLPPELLTPMKTESFYKSGTKLVYTCDSLMETYERRESLPSTTAQSLQRVESVLTIGIIILIVGNLIAVAFFVRRVAGRIFIISENIARFERQELLLPAQQATDEIGAIDQAFHNLARALTDASVQERIMIENATDVVCSMDTKGEFVAVSQASLDQWGYEPEELIGGSVEKQLMATNIMVQFEKWNFKIGEATFRNFEERLTRKDGVEIDTLWSVHWSPVDGAYFCCVRDISESKKLNDIIAAQEEQLRNVFENMPIGIVTVDRRGTVKGANKIGMELLSIDREQTDNRTIVDYLDTNDKADAIASIGPSNPVRFAIKETEESRRFVDVTSVKSLARQNEVLILLDDATERHLLDQMKKDLINLLGNNLRDPLEKVRSMVRELIERKAFDDARQARLKRIDANVKRLLSLIEQLLNVERLGVGKLIGEMKPCTIQDIIAEAVESTRDYSEQQKIQLIWNQSSTPASIVGDAQRLVQVIINLIGNAIKYSPANTMVSVTVIESASEVEVKISDQGRGVPEHMRESIFQPFTQTEASDGRRGSGTGLGLSICRQIIEGHGGKIGVRAGEESRGSVFWIKLPKSRSTSEL